MAEEQKPQLPQWEEKPEEKDLVEWEYNVVMAEAKAGKSKTQGRPWSITLEKYRTFTLFYMHTQMKASSCRRALIDPNAIDRLMAESPTFRVVMGMLDDDTKFIARFNISRSIRGREEQKVKMLDEHGKEIEKTLPAIPPSVEDSKWALSTMFKDKEAKPTGPQLGVPQTEQEVENMAKMLSLYYELTRSTTSDTEGDITGSNPTQE